MKIYKIELSCIDQDGRHALENFSSPEQDFMESFGEYKRSSSFFVL